MNQFKNLSKRGFAIFLVVVMLMTLLPLSAFAEEEIPEAPVASAEEEIIETTEDAEVPPLEGLKAALDSGVEAYTLTGDVTVSETLVIRTSYLTLDLGGFTITDDVENGPALLLDIGESGWLTIMNGSIVSTEAASGSAITMLDGAVYAQELRIDTSASGGGAGHWGSNAGVRVEGGLFNLEETSSILSNQAGIITLKNSTTNVFGKVETISCVDGSGYAAIMGNGKAENAGTSVNLYGFAQVIGVTMGIYHPQQGELNLMGGTITAGTGIGIKSGNLYIYGTAINAVGAGTDDPDTNNNGIDSDGSVILVEANDAYAKNVSITIDGTETVLTSANGSMIREIGSVDGGSVINSLQITDGRFTAGPDAPVFDLPNAVENMTVQGGWFSGDVKAYLPESMTQENGYVVSGEAFYAYFQSFATLQEAIDVVSSLSEDEDRTISFNRDVYLEKPVVIASDVILDMNGHTLTAAGEVLNVTGGHTTVNNGTVETTGSIAVRVVGDSTFTLDAGAAVTGPAHGILLRDAQGSAPTVNVYGTVKAAYAIQGNGLDRAGSTINVEEGANVLGEVIGIYHPQVGTLNINGGTVQGMSAIGIKSGTLNVNGGTITATLDTYEEPATFTNGIDVDGSAIIVDSNTSYAGEMRINISVEATVESKSGYAIREIGSDSDVTNIVSLTITGGTFTAGGQETPVRLQTAENESVAVSGGQFDNLLNENYLAEGFCQKADYSVDQHNIALIENTGVDATCETAGSTEGYHCADCGLVIQESEPIPATGHTVVTDEAVAPTCTQTGLTEGSHCASCNYVFQAQQEVPMISHTAQAVAETPATCTETGLTAGEKCAVCGAVISGLEDIPMIPHTPVAIPETPATCSAPGLTAGEKCAVCDTITVAQEVTDMIPHTPVTDPAVDPTCTESGLTEGTHCSVCQAVIDKQNVVLATGHTPVVDPAVEAGCTTTGLTEGSHCSVCDAIIVGQTVVPEKGHDYIVEEGTDATCTEPGFSLMSHCAVCQMVFTEPQVIPVKPHTDVVVPGTPATCTESGLTDSAYCSVCGTVTKEQEVLPATGHTEDDGTVTVEPAIGVEGQRVFHCAVCGIELRTETIPALTPPPVGPSGPVGGSTNIGDIDVPLATVLPFDDVAQSDWYYDAVQFVYENGLMQGVSDNAFQPGVTISRGMLVTILYRLEGEPDVTGECAFDDVASGAWYTDAVIWGTANNIISGYGNGNFGPQDDITREQFAAILYRYAQLKGYDTAVSSYVTAFADSDQISNYAKAAMDWAVSKELIRGMGNGEVSPLSGASRAQAASILMSFCQSIAK